MGGGNTSIISGKISEFQNNNCSKNKLMQKN